MVRLGLVVAEFNRDITSEMEEVAREHANFLDADIAETVYVPGVYDMPLFVKKLCQRDDIDAVVTLGVVIEGDTDHDDVVVSNASQRISDLSLEYDTPVALGVSGPGMSRIEAHSRVDYAKRGVESAVKMARRLSDISS